MANKENERPTTNEDTGRKPDGDNSNEENRKYPGRTIRDTASSYSSVGGKDEARERPTDTSPVHDVAFRPGPGGVVEEEPKGEDIPFTGEAASTRGSTFEENPDTGRTPEEEMREMLTHSLERRTRAHESG